MKLCETCTHWRGGRGTQKGQSLCAKHQRPPYHYPETVFDPHGFFPARKNCHVTELVAPTRKEAPRHD